MTATTHVPDETAAIYAYPAGGRGDNTPLHIPGMEGFGLCRHPAFRAERRAHLDEGRAPRWLGPYTLADGRKVRVRPAACGAGCFCAAEYKVVR